MKILMAKQYNKDDLFLPAFKAEMERRDIRGEIIQRFIKDDVLALLKRDSSFTLLIMEEYLQPYMPADIDFFDELLTIAPKLKIIFIASEEHKSEKRLLKSLYNAGISNILFEEDADARNVVDIILNQRNDNLVKSYLGLDYDEETVFLSHSTEYTNNSIEKVSSQNKEAIDYDFQNAIEEKTITKQKIIKKEIVTHIYSIPQDYKKVIAIIGFENSGTTTIAVNLSYELSRNKIKTSLIDTDYRRKDIYYHFSKDYFECLSQVENKQDCFTLGQAINKYLTVFSEHNDVEFELHKDSLNKLIGQAKKNSDIVVLDVSSTLKEEVIKSLLEFADNILIVVNQNINKLYRMSKEILRFNASIDTAQIVINKYIDKIPHLDKESIRKNFFKDLLVEKYDLDQGINKAFVVRDDFKSILVGLAERRPAISMKDCIFKEDISEIANFYYKKSKKNKGLLNNIVEFLKK